MQRNFTLVALVISLILSGLLLYAMPCGPWAFSDSAAYLATSQNLVEGKGFGYFYPDGSFELLTLHPPLYSLLISVPVFIGVSPLKAAAGLNLLAFVLWFTTSANLLYRITGSKLLSLVPCLVLCAHADFLSLFTGAMTEGVFVWLSFSGLLLLVDRLNLPQAKALALPALFLALAALTRFIGIAFILTGAALILFFTQAKWHLRIFKATTFAVFAVLPLSIWLLLSSLPGEGIGSRTFSPASNGMLSALNYTIEFKEVMITWLPYISRLTQFLSIDYRLTLMAVTALAFTGVIFYLARKNNSGKEFIQTAHLSVALLLCAIIYIAVHLSQYSFAFPTPDVSARILSPLLIAGIFYFYACLRSVQLLGWLKLRWIPVVVALIFTLVMLFYQRPRTLEFLGDMHRAGDGFTEVVYCQSGLLSKIATLSTDFVLVSNQPNFPLLHINRMAEQYPLTNSSEPYYVLLLRRSLEMEFGAQQAENILALHQSQCQTEYTDSAGVIFLCSK